MRVCSAGGLPTTAACVRQTQGPMRGSGGCGRGASFPSLAVPSPSNCTPPALFAACVAKAWLSYFLFFFFLRRKQVDGSLRSKSCAIQQMSLLFRFVALLTCAAQLNIIDAGSWFAVWAIWRRISFFVIMPRRRLKGMDRTLILKRTGKRKPTSITKPFLLTVIEQSKQLDSIISGVISFGKNHPLL